MSGDSIVEVAFEAETQTWTVARRNIVKSREWGDTLLIRHAIFALMKKEY